MPAQAPLDRLAAQDFYVRLDWMREHWRDPLEDELFWTRRLERLSRLYQQLPTRYWKRARPRLRELEWSRVYEGRDWRGSLSELRRIVGEWERSRPPLVSCEVCGIAYRGNARLEQHRSLVHGLEEDEG